MTSSGMKRGLAVTAVSALAVAGLPLLTAPANAVSLQDQGTANTVNLLSQYTNTASVKNDGTNTTVSLAANAGTGVATVQFRYSTDGVAYTNIGSPVARGANGAFETEWNTPASLYNTTVWVRAQGLDSLGNNVGAPSDNNAVAISTAAESVELTGPATMGLFDQPYSETVGVVVQNRVAGIASGTTSSLTAPVKLKGIVPGGTETDAVSPAAATGDTSRSFVGKVDFGETYTWDATDPKVDQVAVGARTGAATTSDDAEGFNVYEQKISSIAAAATPPSVQTGGTASVTVVVKDQNGAPIAGAQVYREGTPNVLVGYTNEKGEVTDTGRSAGTHAYYVNTTDTDAYESGVDYRTTVTIGSYTPVASSVDVKSADGTAFDRDEYTAGDVTITVKDQNGQPLANQNFFYSWDYTPFKPTITDTAKTIPGGFVTTDSEGKATLVFPNPAEGEPGGTFVLNGYVNRDNSPGQSSDDLAIAPVSFKAGESDVVWQDGITAQRQAGTTQVFSGSLELADGTTLGNRDLNITWVKGSDGNAIPTDDAVVAAQTNQPAGTTRTSDTTATTKSAANGAFAVALTDPDPAPAGGEPNELDGTLTATGTAAQVGTDATQNLDVDFLTSAAPAHVVASGVTKLIDALATPGRPVSFTVKVTNNSTPGVALANQTVTLTTDHGFFTNKAATAAELKADPAAAEGGLYGEWNSLGSTIQVKTDENGEALVTLAIEKDAGFDDDGAVTSTITMAVGSAVQNPSPFEIVWTTDAEPLNPASVDVALAATGQESTILPDARIDQKVFFNLFAKDQYGNLVADDIDISDNSAVASVTGQSGQVESNFTGESPALTATSTAPGSQAITAKWTNETNTWTDGNPAPGFQAARKTTVDGKTVQDTSDTLSWYTVDFAASSYRFRSDPAGGSTVPVGTPVHQDVTVKDQKGQPIDGLDVTFVRSGPNEQGGDFNHFDVTGAAGRANYDWVGTTEGVAKVSAFVYDTWDRDGTGNDGTGSSGELVKKFTADPITFGGRQRIAANLKLSNNRLGNDVAFVNAPSAAAGAKVRLFRVRANGTRVLIRTKTANAAGNARFVVFDRNKRQLRTFQARVLRTAKTWADWTPKRRIR